MHTQALAPVHTLSYNCAARRKLLDATAEAAWEAKILMPGSAEEAGSNLLSGCGTAAMLVAVLNTQNTSSRCFRSLHTCKLLFQRVGYARYWVHPAKVSIN